MSGSAIAVGAEKSSVTDKTIGDYENARDLLSYEAYLARYCADLKSTDKTVTVSALDDLTFVSTAGDKVTVKNGNWTLTTKDGTVCTDPDALPEGYVLSDLVHLEEYDGRKAVYTPSVGSTTWKIDLSASGITEKALYNIAFSYYPINNKNATPEREFYINGTVPFREARSLSLAKNWGSYRSDSGEVLTATYQPSKKIRKNQEKLDAELAQAQGEVEAVGLKAYISGEGADKVLIVERPTVITSKINEMIDKYALRFFVTDSSRNEMRPTMLQTPKWMEYTVHDSDGYYSAPLRFALEPDENGCISLTLTGVNEPVAFDTLTLTFCLTNPTYEEYLARLKNSGASLEEGKDVVRIEGENTVNTSTNVVYPVEDRSDALTSPIDTGRTMLNTIGTEKWETAGQWIRYQFSVNSSGMYEIFSRFKQSYLDGM